MGIYVNFEGMTRIFAQAHREGRDMLFEHEVYELIRALGGETIPHYLLLPRGERLTGEMLAAIPGERIVVKAISPYIVHKSDVGGVRVVPKEPDAVLSTVRGMTYEVPESYAARIERAHDDAPDVYRGLTGDVLTAAVSRDMRGLLLVQFMPVSHEFGNELIVSLRYTREFGMIITAGLGGTDTELYTESLKKGRAVVAASTEMTSGEAFFRLFRDTLSYKKLAGLTRGQKRIVTDEQLHECFSALIAVGNFYSPARADAPFVIRELEVNPFAFSQYLMLPLDGLCRFSAPEPPAVSPRPIGKIDKLLHPTTIGIVGASEKELNVGRIILQNVRANGFPPAGLRLVHPKAAEIDGLPTLPSVRDLPEKLDLVILAVRADQALEMVGQIVEGDLAEAVILIPGGLGEVRGSEERARQIRAKIHEAHLSAGGGPVFVGGNSLGILSHPGRYDSLFIPETKLPKHRGAYDRKSVFISQSGAFMITRMSKLLCMDPAYALSIGNQVDLTVSDIVAFVNQRPEIRTVAVYMEGFNDLDGLAFAKAVHEAVLAGKEVLLYKAGRTQEGKTATSGHTASIAGDYMVCESCVRQAGAMVADTFEEFEGLFCLSQTLHDKTIASNRLAVVCNAGFESVGCADNIQGDDYALTLARFGDQSRRKLSRILQKGKLDTLVEIKNPLDLTPMATEEVYEAFIHALLEDPNVDAVIAGVTPLAPLLRTLPEEMAAAGHGKTEQVIAKRLIKLAGHDRKPLVAVVDGGALYDPLVRALEAGGVPVFRSADRAVAILGKYIAGRLRADGISREAKKNDGLPA